MIRRGKTTLALSSFFVLAASICEASSISVNNPSFEAQALCDGCFVSTITGWVTSPGGGDGVLDPTAAQYPGGIPDGENVGYINSPGNHIDQILTAVLEADMEYTLQIDIGNRLGTGFAGYIIQLRANGIVLAEDNSTLSPADGTFVTATVTYTATDTDPHPSTTLTVLLRRQPAPGLRGSPERRPLMQHPLQTQMPSTTIVTSSWGSWSPTKAASSAFR